MSFIFLFSYKNWVNIALFQTGYLYLFYEIFLKELADSFLYRIFSDPEYSLLVLWWVLTWNFTKSFRSMNAPRGTVWRIHLSKISSQFCKHILIEPVEEETLLILRFVVIIFTYFVFNFLREIFSIAMVYCR